MFHNTTFKKDSTGPRQVLSDQSHGFHSPQHNCVYNILKIRSSGLIGWYPQAETGPWNVAVISLQKHLKSASHIRWHLLGGTYTSHLYDRIVLLKEMICGLLRIAIVIADD
uniref:Uncharacterized protein n=1 Tax=Romanomermis culicivorax TaxID=13658 RepID=A0A915IG35_ROMCU